MTLTRFEKFSVAARRALSLSQEQAMRFNHNYIGTEHLLLGLTVDGSNGASRTLAAMNVSTRKIQSAIEFIIGRGERHIPGEIGLTERAKKVLQLAVENAREEQTQTDTRQILAGMLREGEGVAAGVLESMGVTVAKLKHFGIGDDGEHISAKPPYDFSPD